MPSGLNTQLAPSTHAHGVLFLSSFFYSPPHNHRPTAEFWLRPEHVVRFKAAVMRHLPILIYGDRTRLTESEGRPPHCRCCVNLTA